MSFLLNFYFIFLMDFVKILNLWLIVILFQSSTLESLRSLDAADLAITGLAGICSLETLTTTRSHWSHALFGTRFWWHVGFMYSFHPAILGITLISVVSLPAICMFSFGVAFLVKVICVGINVAFNINKFSVKRRWNIHHHVAKSIWLK